MHKSLRRVSDLDGVSIWGWRRYQTILVETEKVTAALQRQCYD